MDNKYPTKVIFRKFPDGEIIALFPEINNDFTYYHCMSYMHVGQHGAADYQLVLQQTKLAKLSEYKYLYEELERIGYKLKTMKRYAKPYRD